MSIVYSFSDFSNAIRIKNYERVSKKEGRAPRAIGDYDTTTG